MKSAYILPTGDEIRSGIVLDLDAPEIVRQIVKAFPQAEVTRLCPLLDVEDTIFNKIKEVDENASHEIYGKNGHMWSKLVCGKKGSTIIINVPGPYVEAQAACEAFLSAYTKGLTLDEISLEMANAVLAKYPVGAAKTV